MIFPAKLRQNVFPARAGFRLQCPSAQESRENAAPAVAAPPPGDAAWSRRSFSAQLLELGLRHNMPELVRKSAKPAPQGGAADSALRLYADAQNGFLDRESLPLLMKWDA